jgi:hypothetical protein
MVMEGKGGEVTQKCGSVEVRISVKCGALCVQEAERKLTRTASKNIVERDIRKTTRSETDTDTLQMGRTHLDSFQLTLPCQHVDVLESHSHWLKAQPQPSSQAGVRQSDVDAEEVAGRVLAVSVRFNTSAYPSSPTLELD